MHARQPWEHSVVEEVADRCDATARHPTACIPSRDARASMERMTTQIAVRLPDEMVHFLDQNVAAGKAPSRAALVSRAVEREMRRQAAEGDAARLREHGAADDLDDLVAWAPNNATSPGSPATAHLI